MAAKICQYVARKQTSLATPALGEFTTMFHCSYQFQHRQKSWCLGESKDMGNEVDLRIAGELVLFFHLILW